MKDRIFNSTILLIAVVWFVCILLGMVGCTSNEVRPCRTDYECEVLGHSEGETYGK